MKLSHRLGLSLLLLAITAPTAAPQCFHLSPTDLEDPFQYTMDLVDSFSYAKLAREKRAEAITISDSTYQADDMQRQRVLERAGWVFWRCFASAFIRRRKDMLDDLLKTLTERGIEPIGAEGAPRSVHTEHRIAPSITEPTNRGNLIPIEVPEGGQTTPPAPLPALTAVRLKVE